MWQLETFLNVFVWFGATFSGPPMKNSISVGKLTEAKASPEVVHSMIDAHRGGYEEPLGYEHLYQQGD